MCSFMLKSSNNVSHQMLVVSMIHMMVLQVQVIGAVALVTLAVAIRTVLTTPVVVARLAVTLVAETIK